MKHYKQCRLINENTGAILMSWIDEAGAKKGYRVTLDGLPGWWVVNEAYQTRLPAESVAAMSVQSAVFKKHDGCWV